MDAPPNTETTMATKLLSKFSAEWIALDVEAKRARAEWDRAHASDTKADGPDWFSDALQLDAPSARGPWTLEEDAETVEADNC